MMTECEIGIFSSTYFLNLWRIRSSLISALRKVYLLLVVTGPNLSWLSATLGLRGMGIATGSGSMLLFAAGSGWSEVDMARMFERGVLSLDCDTLEDTLLAEVD